MDLNFHITHKKITIEQKNLFFPRMVPIEGENSLKTVIVSNSQHMRQNGVGSLEKHVYTGCLQQHPDSAAGFFSSLLAVTSYVFFFLNREGGGFVHWLFKAGSL